MQQGNKLAHAHAYDRLGIDLDKDGKFPDGSSTNALHSQNVP